MAAGKIALGALLCALATTAASERSHVERDDSDARGASAVVIRASAPLRVIEGRGDLSLHGHLVGRDLRLGLAWSSGEGYVRFGAVIAAQSEP